jgi:hypothetical protein
MVLERKSDANEPQSTFDTPRDLAFCVALRDITKFLLPRGDQGFNRKALESRKVLLQCRS